MPLLPDSIRYSETLEASPAELIDAVREQGFEGIVAKRRDSPYKPDQRSAAWQKMRILQRRDFVIGGYTRDGDAEPGSRCKSDTILVTVTRELEPHVATGPTGLGRRGESGRLGSQETACIVV